MTFIIFTRRLFVIPCLIIASFLFFNACTEEKPTEPDGPSEGNPDLITSTIGPGGGELKIEDFSLSVPAGSFQSEATLSLSISENDLPFGEDQLSQNYKIEGLPLDYSEPLKISIKYGSASSSGKNLLAIGEKILAHGKIDISYAFLTSSDSNGYLIGDIPIPDEYNGVSNLFKTNMEAVTTFVTTVKYGVHTSSAGNFSIRHADVNINGAQALGNYLEEAYQKVLDLGFNYKNRTDWPVYITLRKLKDGTDALTSCSWFGNNYGYIEFNTDLLNDLPKLRRTAGHEFFHLIQFLYDPRSGFAKSSKASSFHWVNEATAAWFEEKFTDIEDYMPDVLNGGEHHPFDGMQFYLYDENGNEKSNLMGQCYGRTPIIKYLVTRYKEDIIIKIYNDLKTIDGQNLNGMTTVKAVCQYNSEEWWNDFIKEYLLGNVYSEITHDLLRRGGTKAGTFQVLSESDKAASYTKDYPFLSASLYIVQLSYEEINQNSRAIFTISSASKRYLSVFKFKPNGNVEHLNSDKNEVIVEDLRTLTNNNWHLYALVCNNYYTSPYNTSDRVINLDIKIDEEEPPIVIEDGNYSCYVSKRLTFDLREEISGTDGSLETREYSETFASSNTVSGVVSGGVFTGIHDDDTTMVTFSNDFRNINYSLFSHYWSGFNNVNSTYRIDAIDIPLYSNTPSYQVTGLDVANYISYADYTRTEFWIEGDIRYTKNVTTTKTRYENSSKIFIIIGKL